MREIYEEEVVRWKTGSREYEADLADMCDLWEEVRRDYDSSADFYRAGRDEGYEQAVDDINSVSPVIIINGEKYVSVKEHMNLLQNQHKNLERILNFYTSRLETACNAHDIYKPCKKIGITEIHKIFQDIKTML